MLRVNSWESGDPAPRGLYYTSLSVPVGPTTSGEIRIVLGVVQIGGPSPFGEWFGVDCQREVRTL